MTCLRATQYREMLYSDLIGMCSYFLFSCCFAFESNAVVREVLRFRSGSPRTTRLKNALDLRTTAPSSGCDQYVRGDKLSDVMVHICSSERALQ